ncbi:MAG: ATP-binding protein [Bacillota bacterium]
MKHYASLIRHSGNSQLFTAVEMSIISAVAGYPLHLHVEGLRGTGKTTILRAARQIMPRIERIKGCPYNCHPDRPHCPQHRSLGSDQIEREWIPMPFLEISHSAKIGTVVGSIDLGRLMDGERPEAALLPGSLPRAHRGIVFIDEVNRLADTSPELADVLLDIMGTRPGRIQIEETGLETVELPVEVTVWAASNPDEDPGPLADIRRQLSDRFDLTIAMARPTEASVICDILADAGRGDHPASAHRRLIEGLSEGGRLMGEVLTDAGIHRRLAALYLGLNLESLRAVEAVQLAARAAAAWSGRRQVALEDLTLVAPLALQHRVDALTLQKVAKLLSDAPDDDTGPSPARLHSDRGEERPGQRSAAGGAAGTAGVATFDTPGTAWHNLFARLREKLRGRREERNEAPAGIGLGGPESLFGLSPFSKGGDNPALHGQYLPGQGPVTGGLGGGVTGDLCLPPPHLARRLATLNTDEWVGGDRNWP